MKKKLPSLKEIQNFPQLQLVPVSDSQSEKDPFEADQEIEPTSELTQKLLSRLEKTVRDLGIDHGPLEVVLHNDKILH